MSRDTAASREHLQLAAWRAGLVLLVTVSAVATSWLIGTAVSAIAGDRMAPWILGRAAGITSYLLLVALVLMGLALSHPGRARWRRPSSATRIRTHVSLSVFTFLFVVLHIVVLATDSYAGVGWWGTFVPMGASYRPLPVTLGVIALYAGLAAGLTASLAGRWARRVWWPIHKVAIVSLVLVCADSAALLGMYVLTGLAVLGLAISRYTTATARDGVEELAAESASELLVHRTSSSAPVVAATTSRRERRAGS